MKTEAISNHERCVIVHELAERFRWQGNRLGFTVIIVRLNKLEIDPKRRVQWAIETKRSTKAAGANQTVSDAIDEINAFIRSHSPKETTEHQAKGESLFGTQGRI